MGGLDVCVGAAQYFMSDCAAATVLAAGDSRLGEREGERGIERESEREEERG